jgi:F0F1-type ATP synthase membrane subunit c/vacuolar-type H+-ATPase subunit K
MKEYTREDILAALARKNQDSGGAVASAPANNTYTRDDIMAALAKKNQELTGVSKTESALRGAGQGVTFDLGDEIAGGLAALGSIYDGGNIIDNAKKSYIEQRDATRAANKLAQEANPKTYLGSNIAGSLVTPGGAIKAAKTLPQLAKVGAGAGILSGLGVSEEELGSAGLVQDAAIGGAIGGVAAPVVGGIVNKITGAVAKNPAQNLTRDSIAGSSLPENIKSALVNAEDDVIQNFSSAINKGLNPEQALIKAEADKLGVRLSAGDITQDVIRQGDEDLALKGVYGERAMGEARAFRDAQQADIAKLGQNISQKVGGGLDAMPAEADVASSVSRKLKEDAATAKKTAQGAYDEVAYDASVRSSDIADLPSVLRGKLEAANVDIEGIPAINRRLKEIGAIVGKTKTKMQPTGLLDEAGKPIMKSVSTPAKDITFATADNFRKRINASIINNANANERRALNILKDSYDEYLDGVIDKGLVQGDDQVINQLRNAQGLWRDYKQKYYGSDGKALVGKIIDNDYTPEQTINFIIGSSDAGAKKEAATAVSHLKNVLGADSPEFRQLQQLQFTRLFGDNFQSILDGNLTKSISGEKYAKNVDKLLSQNRTLAETLYTPEQLNLIKSGAKVAAQATARKPGAVNYSGTTPVLLRFANNVLSRFGPVGQYAAGAVNKVTKGAINAKKEVDLSQSFSGAIPRGVNKSGKPLNPFASSLAQAVGRTAASQSVPEKDVNFTSVASPRPTEPSKNTGAVLTPVDAAISKAAEISGIEQDLLTAIAKKESGLNPRAKNPNSSAAGLMQLTDATWNSMVDRHGDQLGIKKSDRYDPEANATLGALLTRENKQKLTKVLGRAPSTGELYTAHFFGLPASKKIIQNKNSTEIAARVFPKEARANRNIFFEGRRPRTMSEVYQVLTSGIDV